MPNQLLGHSRRHPVRLKPSVKGVAKSMKIGIPATFIDIRNPCGLFLSVGGTTNWFIGIAFFLSFSVPAYPLGIL